LEDNGKGLTKKLDTLIRLLALSITEGKKPVEKIKLLGRADLPPKEIASILKTTANSVRVALHRERHGKIRRQKSRR
jgi:hypothetical protein